jgi:hypothetical protein
MTRQQGDEPPVAPGWENSPPGEVRRLRQRLRGRRRRRAFLRAAATAAAGLFVTGGGLALWWGLVRPREYDYGGITCSEVRRLAEDYRMGKLAAAERERVRVHLARCPHCKLFFERMRS